MKKQKMFSAKEVAKLLNNQAQLSNIKKSNIEYVTKKKPVKIKKAAKQIAKQGAKKPKNKVKSVSQKRLFSIEKIKTQPKKKLPIKKESISKKESLSKIRELPKKEIPQKKRPTNFFSKLLNCFKKKRN